MKLFLFYYLKLLFDKIFQYTQKKKKERRYPLILQDSIYLNELVTPQTIINYNHFLFFI